MVTILSLIVAFLVFQVVDASVKSTHIFSNVSFLTPCMYIIAITYLGCYSDIYWYSHRALPYNPSSGGSQIDQVSCFAYADAFNYTLVGFQDQIQLNSGLSQCWLGNSYVQATGYGTATECYLDTTHGYYTGGSYVNAVYSILPIGAPSSPSVSPTALPTSSSQDLITYLGCYNDYGDVGGDVRALPFNPTSVATTQIDQVACFSYAKANNYEFVGFQSQSTAYSGASECWLGNSYSDAIQYGTATGCYYDPTHGYYTGGGWVNGLYRITLNNAYPSSAPVLTPTSATIVPTTSAPTAQSVDNKSKPINISFSFQVSICL